MNDFQFQNPSFVFARVKQIPPGFWCLGSNVWRRGNWDGECSNFINIHSNNWDGEYQLIHTFLTTWSTSLQIKIEIKMSEKRQLRWRVSTDSNFINIHSNSLQICKNITFTHKAVKPFTMHNHQFERPPKRPFSRQSTCWLLCTGQWWGRPTKLVWLKGLLHYLCSWSKLEGTFPNQHIQSRCS